MNREERINASFHNSVEKGPLIPRSLQSKKNYLLWIPIGFLILAFFVFLSILISTHHNGHPKESKEAYDTYHNIQKNIISEPILDIKFVPYKSQCPSGFNQEDFGKWAGSHTGCVCKKGKTEKNGVVFDEEHCQKHKHTCTQVKKSHDSIPYNFYNKLKHCTKRTPHWKFVKETEKCASGWSKCHKNMCVKGSICPITNLVYTDGTANPSNPTERKYLSLSKIILERKKDDLPITDFRTAFTSIHYPCVNHNHRARMSGNAYYGLENIPNKGCGVYGDTFDYTQPFLAYDQTEKFFKTNEVFPKVDSLPYFWDVYVKTANVDLYLVKKIILKNKEECNSLPSTKSSELKNGAYHLHNLNSHGSIVLLVFSAIGIIAGILYLAYISLDLDLSFLNKFGYLALLAISVLVAIGAIIFFCCFMAFNYNHSRNNLEEISKNNCFNVAKINEVNKDILDFYHSHGNWNEWLVYVIFIASILYLLLMAISLFKRKKTGLPIIPDFK